MEKMEVYGELESREKEFMEFVRMQKEAKNVMRRLNEVDMMMSEGTHHKVEEGVKKKKKKKKKKVRKEGEKEERVVETKGEKVKRRVRSKSRQVQG